MMTDVPRAVQSNPVTTTAALGAVIAAVGRFAGWDAEAQLMIAQGFLGAAVLVRAAIAGWHAWRSR